jgi:UDP-N-acetylglucosamine 2-epimerase
MMKIINVVGARLQFIKAAMVSRALRPSCQEILVHTGQHYDESMSKVFFEELGLPVPDIYLGIGSDTHARQTRRMMMGIEEILLQERLGWVIVYGDTNSQLSGALAVILDTLGNLEIQVVFPAHPRAQQVIKKHGIPLGDNVRMAQPVNYLAMLQLEARADCILTDSGGVQRDLLFQENSIN